MCERRIRKIKKGSHMTRLRETRRLQRLQRIVTTPPPPEEPLAPCPEPAVDKTAQCRLILELALKTINLMQKNSMIQQKIIALQKETSDFVAQVMSNPENKKRYLEHLRLHGSAAAQPVHAQVSFLPATANLEPGA
ncbi:uncharacterized protein LOC126380666 [Pectinophora gossypiella]|uniref:uncharacterized protein LOC126380666 n=1 Tax=Pectinophora gossypiella TaxID=13191 RepID=UPI00214E678B|nr:uncharacterized protein LOC126380666 [Pectinophora gossypiella]